MLAEGALALDGKANIPEIDVYSGAYTPLVSYPEYEKKLNDDL
jgi:hypothetical protein